MKFQPDSLAGTNAITRHEPGRLWVGSQLHEGSLIVPWQGTCAPWRPTGVLMLEPSDFDAVLDSRPEVVILGTGWRLHFPKPEVLRPLIQRGIGMESMDSAAAVRTYNVLASEGRRVVGAFILDSG